MDSKEIELIKREVAEMLFVKVYWDRFDDLIEERNWYTVEKWLYAASQECIIAGDIFAQVYSQTKQSVDKDKSKSQYLSLEKELRHLLSEKRERESVLRSFGFES